MALSKDLRQEIVKADRIGGYSLFTGEILLSEDFTLWNELGNDLSRYESLEQDTHIAAVMRKRRMGVTAKEYVVIASDVTNEDEVEGADLCRKCLELFNFDETCLHLLNAILLGHSEAEIIWGDDKLAGFGDIGRPVEIRGKEASRFSFAKPYGGKINVANQQVKGYELRQSISGITLDGTPLPKNKIIHHSYGSKSGNPNGKGDGSVLWWMSRFKREVVKSWLIFLDKFASPTPLGTYPVGGNKTELEECLNKISQGTWAAIPEGYKIHFLEAQRAGTVSTYEDFETWCDNQISKCVLGETLSTEMGSNGSRAASETHNTVRLELAKADSDLLSYNLKEYLLAPIMRINRPGVKPPSVWRVFEEQTDLTQRVSQDKTLFDMGFRLTIEKVTEIYGDGYVDTQAPSEGDLESILSSDAEAQDGTNVADETKPTDDPVDPVDPVEPVVPVDGG